VRFTVSGCEQGRDVEVVEGSRLGDLRGPLSRLTGVTELADPQSVLAIGDLVVADDHLCGQVPFDEGCVLRVGRAGPDAASVALRSAWHLAVLSGPDSGALLAVEGPVTVGRDLTCDLAVDDPRMSRNHVVIRPRRTRLLVRDICSVNGTERRRRTRSGRPRARRLRASWTRPGGYRLRDGDRLALGSTVVEVRSRDRREEHRGASAPLPRPPAPPGPPLSPMALTTWLTPMITGAMLALSMGQRGLLLLALSGPAIAAVPYTSRWRATRASHRQAPSTTATMVSAADVASDVQRRLEDHPQPGPVPAALLRDLVPDGCLAVVGRRDLALGAARSLVLGALASPTASPGVDLRIGHPAEATSDWEWCRWGLIPSGPATVGAADPAPLLVVDPADGAWPGWLAGWWHASVPRSQLMLIAREGAAVPAWCRSSLEVTEQGAVLRLPDGSEHPVPLMCVSRSRAETLARRLAALRDQAPAPRVAMSSELWSYEIAGGSTR